MSTYLLAVAWMWAIAAISPGPNFLFIAQIAASKSRSAALAAVCGTGLVTLIWGVCGVTGVHAVFLAAPWAYLALKIVGAVYLVCSGALMMVRSCKRRNINSPGTAARGRCPGERPTPSAWQRVLQIPDRLYRLRASSPSPCRGSRLSASLSRR